MYCMDDWPTGFPTTHLFLLSQFKLFIVHADRGHPFAFIAAHSYFEPNPLKINKILV